MSKASTQRVVALVRDQLIFKDVPAMRVGRLRRLMAEPHFEELMDLYRADCGACHGIISAAPRIEEMRQKLQAEALLPPPLLSGKDVLNRGVPSGPGVGELLARVVDLQLEGELVDREAAPAWLDRVVSSEERSGA